MTVCPEIRSRIAMSMLFHSRSTLAQSGWTSRTLSRSRKSARFSRGSSGLFRRLPVAEQRREKPGVQIDLVVLAAKDREHVEAFPATGFVPFVDPCRLHEQQQIRAVHDGTVPRKFVGRMAAIPLRTPGPRRNRSPSRGLADGHSHAFARMQSLRRSAQTRTSLDGGATGPSM